jgi:hypothetical protein
MYLIEYGSNVYFVQVAHPILILCIAAELLAGNSYVQSVMIEFKYNASGI